MTAVRRRRLPVRDLLSECGAAWERTWFGTRGSRVQIPPFRPMESDAIWDRRRFEPGGTSTRWGSIPPLSSNFWKLRRWWSPSPFGTRVALRRRGSTPPVSAAANAVGTTSGPGDLGSNPSRAFGRGRPMAGRRANVSAQLVAVFLEGDVAVVATPASNTGGVNSAVVRLHHLPPRRVNRPGAELGC